MCVIYYGVRLTELPDVLNYLDRNSKLKMKIPAFETLVSSDHLYTRL